MSKASSEFQHVRLYTRVDETLQWYRESEPRGLGDVQETSVRRVEALAGRRIKRGRRRPPPGILHSPYGDEL
jgi:hypothetical protein